MGQPESRLEIDLAERRPTPGELAVLRLLAKQPQLRLPVEGAPAIRRPTRGIQRVCRSGRRIFLRPSVAEVVERPDWTAKRPDGRVQALKVPTNPANLRIPRIQATVPKVLLIPIAQDGLFRTDGTTTFAATLIDEVASIWSCLGAQVRAIRVHWSGETFTANFKARIALSWSVQGRAWSTMVEILPEQTGGGQIISARFTDSAAFGRLERAAIEVTNTSGTAIESGRITAVLELELGT